MRSAPLADEPLPLLLRARNRDVPPEAALLPPLEDPRCCADPPEIRRTPLEDPPDEPLDEPPDEPPLPCECWAEETVGVPNRNIGTSTASA